MRLPLRRRHAAHRRPIVPTFLVLAFSSLSGAITFTPAPAANLDFRQLGRVALAGDFSGISLYEFEGQNERPFSTNGSEQLLARMPNGAISSVLTSDATIQTMCTFKMDDRDVVLLGGNFTSIGAVGSGAMQSPAMALFDPEAGTVTPLPGLSGQVNALLCDEATNTVYAGGSFRGANSTNAIAWLGTESWANLPFAGFNGPVMSITKAPNGNIIFGGSFTGLGNATSPTTRDGQVINLSTASISGVSSTSAQGFNDPKNIICKTSGDDGAGNTWLLQDNTPGSWSAKFRYGFQPTKMRLYNTRQDGRGTKEWRFTALPINGIMNFTYTDPQTQANASCTSRCPLSNDPSIPFQEFHFVNVIGMNEFRIDISDFYGAGGGLNGIELFGDDIFSYAINDFNEASSCAGGEFPSTATATGPWTVSPSLSSTSEYLTARLAAPITNSSASIVFTPDIRESGHYSVNLYTPGCLQDNTCLTRGRVQLTGQMTADPTRSEPINLDLYQTNNFDKYDQVYFGAVDASSGSFRPRVTMTPLAGQSLSEMTFVAQRIGFTLINSTGGLNGLYEYKPGTAINASDFMSSGFNKLGASFKRGSVVQALATIGETTYIAGNFSSSTVQNIVAVQGDQATVRSLNGGLNGDVDTLFANGTSLFVGGSFNGTKDNSAAGLNNVALYDTSKNSWNALGSGVKGQVSKIVGMTMNITGSEPELVVSVNGDFTQLLGFGDNKAVDVDGFAVWVPSQNNWLQNLALPVEQLQGLLSASILDFNGDASLYAGSLRSSTLGATGVATAGGRLNRVPANIQPTKTSAGSGTLTKRDDSLEDGSLNSVVTGLFDTSNNRNITILGGHFSATTSSGSTANNLLLIDGKDKDQVSGLPDGLSENSTFVALAIQNDVLFAGGKVSGTVNGANVNGLITYNLASRSFNTQPPILSGGNGTVSSIAVRQSTKDVYVGGSFRSAGALDCPGVCFFTAGAQWFQAGQNLDGNVDSLLWATDNTLLAGGDFKVNDTASTFLAVYDAGRQSWDSYPGASQLPGPVTSLALATRDGSQIWASGTSSSGSPYLAKFDGSNWQLTGESLGAGTKIRSLQVFSLTSSHDDTPLVDSEEALMLTGSIALADFGTASAVLFDGKTFRPYALTANTGNTAGSISHVFTEQNNFFSKGGKKLPLVFIVLIGLGISLALMLLIVVAGLFLDRLRKKREGYVPAPTSMYDRGSGIQRIPPRELFENLSKGRSGVPQV